MPRGKRWAPHLQNSLAITVFEVALPSSTFYEEPESLISQGNSGNSSSYQINGKMTFQSYQGMQSLSRNVIPVIPVIPCAKKDQATPPKSTCRANSAAFTSRNPRNPNHWEPWASNPPNPPNPWAHGRWQPIQNPNPGVFGKWESHQTPHCSGLITIRDA